jgi:integrase
MLRRSNFHESVWTKARQAVRLPNLHFHDLRHTGGTPSVATLKELMAQLGHSTVRAAMIYQHATSDRDKAIAKALGTFFRRSKERHGHARRGAPTGEQDA